MDAIHDVPRMLLNWQAHALGEIRIHLACFPAHQWPGAPDLVAFFNRKLQDFGCRETKEASVSNKGTITASATKSDSSQISTFNLQSPPLVPFAFVSLTEGALGKIGFPDRAERSHRIRTLPRNWLALHRDRSSESDLPTSRCGN
jgi:hypothetical protein